VVDARLVAKVLRADLKPTTGAHNAFDFARLLLRRILGPDDLPVVSSTLKTMRIGLKAREWLKQCPDKLQYLVCSTAKRGDTWSRRRNVKERIFLDVEWDDLPSDDQLKILWWLKVAKEWKLISITFSGGKSYHGLFYTRGESNEKVQGMISLAKRLGACQGSLRADLLVRFPGGLRRDEKGERRQRIVYLNDQFTINSC
jgi:hypothetical protein